MHDALFCAVALFLAPLAAAGLALINTGLNRSRSAAQGILASLVAIAVSVSTYAVLGFAFASGTTRVLFLRGIDWNGTPAFVLLFELFGVGIAALIPVATGAERWRIAAVSASTVLMAGCIFPLYAHWTWGGGWLAQLGFVDAAGSSCIHAVGGFTALALAWILGSRQGKFTRDGMPTAMPGHNAVVVLFGCLLAVVGWLGLNSAGAMLFANAGASACVLIAVNTLLSASAAAIAALTVTRVRFGKPDASLTANGWISGLVASSAAASSLKPAEAMLIGLIAGALVIFAVEIVELRMKVDDPAGAISVHVVGGLCGVFAAGEFTIQLVAVATLIGCILPLAYGLNWLLNLAVRQRVAPEGERQGMDLFELGAGAYPEFVTHREDLLRH
jgi:ammonium transporter, Amt family